MKGKILIMLLLSLSISILTGCRNDNEMLKDPVIATMRRGTL